MSATLTPNSPNYDDHVTVYTRRLCHDIKNTFRRRRQCDLPSSVTPTTNADAKRKLIAETVRWVDGLVEQHHRYPKECLKHTIVDALVSLLREIDDADVENLQLLASRYDSGSSKSKRVNGQKMNQGTCDEYVSNKRQRRRLPHNVRSMDLVQAMHDAEATIYSDDDEQDIPKLFLSNSDRSKRAKKTHLERQQSCSMMGISMKAVMNVQVPNEDVHGSQVPISTLTKDAAVLRRDLYKIIAACDIAEIKSIVEGEGTSSTKDEKLQLKMQNLTTTLLSRITEHPNSPSLRLSAMTALDSIRELGLSDLGYKCILDALLKIRESWSIRFFAEIVSECHAYENPSRLLGISKLMKHALETHEQCTPTPTLLRAVSHIIVRRLNILSSLDQKHCSPLLMREKGVYNRFCNSISIRFGSVSDWILPSMSRDVRESVISALQAVGILPFFCSEDGEDGISNGPLQSSQSAEEYPFPTCVSLRAAHDRLGPCDGFNRLVSHPELYEQRGITPRYALKPPIPSLVDDEDVAGPFSSASEDVLIIVFSFLGFRSLTRASQCCTSWALAVATAPTLWSNLYFKRYKKSRFEEELALKTEASSINPYLRKFLSISSVAGRQQLATTIDGYDWKHLFGNKYATEKRFKGETCSIVGCNYVHRRPDHVKSHVRRHEIDIRVDIRKRDVYRAFRLRTDQLKQEIVSLEKDLHIVTPEPLHLVQTKFDLDDPTSVLRDFIFAYLDFNDIVKPVCKLWTRLAECNVLWEKLYQYHFISPLPLPPTETLQWKNLFRSSFLASKCVRGKKDKFGWSFRICPIVGCNKEFRSKLQFNMHLLKHEDQELRERKNRLNRLRQDQIRNAKRK